MGLIGKALSIVASASVGAIAGAVYTGVEQEKRMDQMDETTEKFKCYYRLLNQWVALKQEGKHLKEYFEANGFQTVAVYGMRELGERFVEEMRDTDIEIKYVIDKNVKAIVTDLPKFSPDDELEEVDVVVVTAAYYYQDIEEEMGVKMTCPIVSLEDVVYGIA